MKAKEFFTDLAKGSSLGTGILPGVSVGTVGLIVNVYDKLINSIDGLRHKETFGKSVLNLIPIGGGCLIATFLLILFWDKVAYPHFPLVIIGMLAGFIVGALPLLFKEIIGQKFTIGDWLRCGLAFLFAAGIGIIAFLCAAGVIPINLNFADPVDHPFQNPWIFAVLFVVGAFSAVSCIVPGISGSMIMFIFGLYNPVIDIFISERGLNGEIIHPSIFEDTSKLGGGALCIGVLLLGMLVGFLVSSKLMKDQLEKHRRGTFTIIVGFVLGSIVAMFFNNDMFLVYNEPRLVTWWQILIASLAFVGVAVGTYFLIRKKSLKESTENADKTSVEKED